MLRIRSWIAPCAAVALVLLVGWGAYARLDDDRRSPQRSDDLAAVERAPGVRGVYVLPEDGRAPLVDELDHARRSIDVMMYLLTDEPIIERLIAAEARGVAVRIILEEHPYGGFGNPEEPIAKLRDGGAEVKWGRRRFPFTHAKMIVIDDSVAVITNANATPSTFADNREFGVVTTSGDDVAQASVLFEADWSDGDEQIDGPLTVSPDTSRAHLTALISSATVSLDIYLEVIRDDTMVELLMDASERGVAVRIVTSPDSDPRGVDIFERLVSTGIQLHILRSPYIHAKVIVLDRTRLFIGSQNLTSTSLDENREVGLVFTDTAAIARVENTFEADFASATPWK